MPTIAERLKELDSVDDAGLMMGYRFLVTPRRRTSAIVKKAPAKNYKASAASGKRTHKSVRRTR
jgi:hypothetical protein